MAAADDLPCQELVELVNDFLEGVLDLDTGTRFERHLDGCPPCATYVEQMRQTIAITGRVNSRALSPAARSRLLETFRDWARTGDTTPDATDREPN